MEGKLWNQVYRIVRQMAASIKPTARRGRPDNYSVDIIALCWLWAAFHNMPLVQAVEQLSTPRLRRRLKKLGFRLPARVPHETTVRRRAKRADFPAFLGLIDQQLISQLRPQRTCCVMDSTPLPVGRMSHDRQAALGVYRSYGYRWHALISKDGVVLGSEVHPGNVHDAPVANELVRQARDKSPIRWLVADAAYDSESLHRLVRQELRGRLVAPLNDRGKRRRCRRTPHRAWLAERWQQPRLRCVWRQRSRIERFFSRLKSSRFGLWALPPWVRHLANVKRWINLKTIYYHVYLIHERQSLAA